jgi:hypothetical protein
MKYYSRQNGFAPTPRYMPNLSEFGVSFTLKGHAKNEE